MYYVYFNPGKTRRDATLIGYTLTGGYITIFQKPFDSGAGDERNVNSCVVFAER